MDIRKMQIVLYVLDKVSDVFPNTRDFIKKELEEKCSKEGISEKELFCFALLFFFFLLHIIADESLCFWC